MSDLISQIKTDSKSDTELVTELRQRLGLNQYPYSDIDDDLIILAFTFDEIKNSKETNRRLLQKYGTKNLQSLEAIGDKILYGVVGGIIHDTVGLTRKPHFISQAISYMTNNRTLLEIMSERSVCPLLRSKNYTIDLSKQKFHNRCSDSFESLISAMYIHLTYKKLNQIEYIKNWILKYTIFPVLLYNYFIENGEDYNVYKINDVDMIQLNLERKMESMRQQTLDALEDEREYLPGEVYYGLYDIFLNRDLTIYDPKYIPERSLLVFKGSSKRETLNNIYKKLLWDRYLIPEYMKRDSYGFFNIDSPNGVIASSEETADVLNKALQYLLDMGYITYVPNKI